MSRLTNTEQARCIGYLEAFQADLLTMIHDAWIKNGSPAGGSRVKFDNEDNVEGMLLPLILKDKNPEFLIIQRSQYEDRIIAGAQVLCARDNDYTVIGIGKLCSCTLLSEVIVKAKTILLNIDS